MRMNRTTALVGLGLAAACGGASQPAAAPESLSTEDVVKQTEAACHELQDCELIDPGQESFDDCVARGMYAVESGSKSCANAYYTFEECVADLGCGDLELLFKTKEPEAECRKLGQNVQLECNVNVM